MVNIKSKFLCSCGSLLYTEVESNEDYCFNTLCDKHIAVKKLDNYTEAKKEFDKRLNIIKSKIRFFSIDFLEFLADYRDSLFESLDKGMNIKKFHAVNELLLLAANMNFYGRNKKLQDFEKILDDFADLSDLINFTDSLEQEIHFMSKDGSGIKAYQLKYYQAFVEQYRNYGLTTQSKKDEIFGFESIDRVRINEIPFQIGMDMTPYFKQFFRVMIQINMMMNYNYRLSQLFKRPFGKKEVAGLLSIHFSCKGSKIKWDAVSFRKHLERNEFNDEEKRKFEEFIFGGQNRIPFAVKIGQNILFHPITLLFLTLSLLGSLPEKNLANEGKSEASVEFESQIRKKLRENGYLVPLDEEMALLKKGFKYDVVGISEDKREALLIESKYCDLPASAFSGKNLLNIKLNKPNPDEGEIAMAKEHQGRLKEFEENITLAEARLKIKLQGYKIRPMIVTKFSPLAYNIEDIELVSFNDLLNPKDL